MLCVSGLSVRQKFVSVARKVISSRKGTVHENHLLLDRQDRMGSRATVNMNLRAAYQVGMIVINLQICDSHANVAMMRDNRVAIRLAMVALKLSRKEHAGSMYQYSMLMKLRSRRRWWHHYS